LKTVTCLNYFSAIHGTFRYGSTVAPFDLQELPLSNQ